MIAPKSLIVFDPSIDKFVHRLCGQRFCVDSPDDRYRRRRPTKRPRSPGTGPAGPAKRSRSFTAHGLKPLTLETYTQEWDKYTAFAVRRGYSLVPGRDAPWDLFLVYNYMLWRGETCKPTTLARIFSILTHFGTVSGFLLSNSRYDNDSLTYRRLKNMKKQLVLDFSARFGAEALVPNRCTPLSKWTVSLLLSAFGAVCRGGFASLLRRFRAWTGIIWHVMYCSTPALCVSATFCIGSIR